MSSETTQSLSVLSSIQIQSCVLSQVTRFQDPLLSVATRLESMTSYSESKFVTNKAAAKFFIVAFIICLVLHFILMVWRRSWYMTWFLIGVILEVVGYVQLSSGSTSQSASIIIAPIFLAASVYVSFGRLIKHFQAENLSPINTSFFGILFFVCDVVCLAIQIAGIVLQFMNGKEDVGRALVIISFSLQIILFLFFVWNVAVVRRRLGKKVPKVHVDARLQWPSFFILLFGVSILFFIRNVFRLVEYAQGFGYVFYHAVFTYIFDGAPILLISLLLVCFHPSLWMDRTIKKAKRQKKQKHRSNEDNVDIKIPSTP